MRSVFYPRLVNDPFGDPALYVRLAHRGEALLFDCGDLRALTPREVLKLTAVFVSHAHIDHLFGFDTLLRLFLGREKPLLLCGPPGFIDCIGNRLAGYTWNLTADYPLTLRVREWGEPQGREALFRAREAFRRPALTEVECPEGRLLATEDYEVRAVPLGHGGICSLAFVLEETLHVAIHGDALDAHGFLPGPWLTRFKALLRRGAPDCTPVRVPTAAEEETLPLGALRGMIAHTTPGMKIAYVTDAAPHEENLEKIVALARGAALLAIEAPFPHADLDRARQRHHLTARLAGTVARRAGAARLLVFHHSPRYRHEPQLLCAEAHGAFAGEESATA